VWRKTNRFLASLGADLERLRPYFRCVMLRPGQVLWEPGDEVSRVYFLHEGLVSKLAVFEDGTEIECALVGREGAVGATSAMGLKTAVTRDVCHMKGEATVLDSAVLARAAAQSERIHQAIDRYCAWKMRYVIRNGACNARHSVEQRLCRWLLTCSDVLEQDQIDLRQDVFAKMLGVQRTTVNPILRKFHAEGLIDIGRGRVILTDRAGLQRRACECYAVMRDAEQALGLPDAEYVQHGYENRI
jgi:CRP-like cAMP-binding protein